MSLRLILILLSLLGFLFSQTGEQEEYVEDEYEYEVVHNYSANLYLGYPVLKASSFQYYNSNMVYGLSIGTPFGFAIGSFFTNVIGEIFLYDFSTPSEDFKGAGFQVGISPGFFIGDISLSGTAAGGIFHAGTGFIAGGSVDIPVGMYLSDNFDMEAMENFEVRITSRQNIVQKSEGGVTGWIGAGISLGYEF